MLHVNVIILHIRYLINKTRFIAFQREVYTHKLLRKDWSFKLLSHLFYLIDVEEFLMKQAGSSISKQVKRKVFNTLHTNYLTNMHSV